APQQPPLDRPVADPAVKPIRVIYKRLTDVPAPLFDQWLAVMDEAVDLNVRVNHHMQVRRADGVRGPGRPPVRLLGGHLAHGVLEPTPRFRGLPPQDVDLSRWLSHRHLPNDFAVRGEETHDARSWDTYASPCTAPV